ncbi:MAG: outer membrane beta-barrel protein [Prevotella sp.]|jgi:outer membrane protein W|nr:outer membrane beta-barrel protein [Prevotella sp.]
MKKFILLLAVLATTLSANAQFEKGKAYIGAGLTGFDISSQAKKFHLGISAKAGYLFMDNLMATAQIGYEHLKDSPDVFTLGGGARYYIIQNGLYLGASLKYYHTDNYNDFRPGVQLGYAFFISRTVTIEPELYIDFSTKKFEDSAYGLGVSLGIYLFKDQYKLKK